MWCVRDSFLFVVVDCELVSILCGVLETFLFVVVDCELVSILCGVLDSGFCWLCACLHSVWWVRGCFCFVCFLNSFIVSMSTTNVDWNLFRFNLPLHPRILLCVFFLQLAVQTLPLPAIEPVPYAACHDSTVSNHRRTISLLSWWHVVDSFVAKSWPFFCWEHPQQTSSLIIQPLLSDSS